MKPLKNYLNTKVFSHLGILLLLALFTCALATACNMLDYDIWNRLIAGKYILESSSIIRHDFLSYAKTHIWYDPEWLFSCVLYFVLNKFDAFGLNFLKCFLFSIAVFSLFFSLGKKRLEAGAIVLLLPCAFWISSSVYFLRCQIITFILLPVFIYCLEKLRNQNRQGIKYICILAFLNIIWQNCHGGFLIGFILIGLYILGEFFNKKPIKKFLILFIILFLLIAINPWVFDYYGFLYKSLLINRSYITEWKSPILFNIFGAKTFLMYTFISFCTIFHKFLKSKQKDYCSIYVILFFFVSSLMYFKFASLYVIISAIYLFNRFSFKKINRYFNFLIVILILSYSAVVFIKIPFKYSHIRLVSRTFPIFAVEFLKINNIKGNIYAPWGNSGFIAYKTYPNLKIFIDGRQEQVYSSELINKNIDFMYQKTFFSSNLSNSNNPNEIIESNMPDYFMCQRGIPYENYVKKLKNYKLIYDDGFYSVYSSNRKALGLKEIKIPDKDAFYYLDNIYKN